ncbi:MAG: fasciclin domain-containing protein [Cytophagales bacterium]|nr:fasciclin domain-containing protein [Cytophagales bacterium]
MKQRITFALLCVTLLFNSFSGAVAQRPTAGRAKSSLYAQPPRDIVETVALSGQFASLTKAIKAAEMTNALSQAGPFTVFAPTDDAFQKVAAMPDLLEPTGREQLSTMLKYHIVQGKVLAAELRDGQKLLTLNGESRGRVTTAKRDGRQRRGSRGEPRAAARVGGGKQVRSERRGQRSEQLGRFEWFLPKTACVF